MFMARFTIDNEEKFNLYYDNINGWNEFHKDTFSPLTKDLAILRLKVRGKNYQERKNSAHELAVEWQAYFSDLSWSYGELAEIQGYFEKIGKQYGLIKEFRENAIC